MQPGLQGPKPIGDIMSRIEDETKFGWVLEHCPDYEDGEIPVCPTCNEGFWWIVGMFTSREKLTEWMKIRGFEEMPKEYRAKQTVIDEGPLSHTSTEGYIPDSIIENMTEDEVMEYVMQDLENRDKFQEENI